MERRETWEEICDRNMEMHIKKFPELKEERNYKVKLLASAIAFNNVAIKLIYSENELSNRNQKIINSCKKDLSSREIKDAEEKVDSLVLRFGKKFTSEEYTKLALKSDDVLNDIEKKLNKGISIKTILKSDLVMVIDSGNLIEYDHPNKLMSQNDSKFK